MQSPCLLCPVCSVPASLSLEVGGLPSLTRHFAFKKEKCTVRRVAVFAIPMFLFAILLSTPGLLLGQTIQLVQHGTTDNGTASTTAVVVKLSGVVSGDLLTCSLTSGASGATTLAVSDSVNGAWSAANAAHFNAGIGQTTGQYYMANSKAGNVMITGTSGMAGGYEAMNCQEWSGAATTNPLDQGAQQDGTAANPTSGSVTTGSGGELILGDLENVSSPTAGSGLTMINNTATSWLATEYQIQGSAGAAAGSWTAAANGGWTAQVATFRAATGGGGTPGPSISSLSPNTGVVGTVVTIMGTNFGATQGTSTVKFNGTTGTPTSWSATSITVTVPNGATTGSVVVNVGSQNSNGASFTISGAVLSSIAVTPANVSIAPGSTQQFTSTGKYSDGSTQNLTNQVTWSSSALAVVTITNYGLASSVGTGSTTIQAGLNSITGSTTLTVSSALGPTTESTTDTRNNNSIIFTPITIPSGSVGYTLGSFYLWVGTPASATTNVAIYTDNGGVPYQLVCNSSYTGTLGSGFVLMPTPTNCGSFTNSKQYWLANVTSSITQEQGVVAGACPNGGYSRYYSNGGTTFPTTVGTTTQFSSNDCYSQNVIMYPTSPNSIIYWSAGSNGTIPTTSNLSAGTFGILGQSSSSWFLDGNNFTYTNSGEPAYTFQNPFSIVGTTYTGTGTYTLQYATNSSAPGGSVIVKIPPQPSYSIGYAVEWSIPDTDAFNNRYSLSSVGTVGGTDYIDA